MLKGKSINTDSTIGIIAPASPEDKDIINEKIELFKNIGFKIKLGKHLYNKYGHLAGNDFDRASDIIDMFLDKDVDGIICFRGGYGSIRTLKYINKNIIKNNPKFFCGFSDITILLNYFASLGLITFHGPMINSNFADEKTLEYLLKIASFTGKNYTYDLNLFNEVKIINGSDFSGKIVGGNLSMICSSIGTPYEIKTNSSILLIEEVNEYPYAIDRMLTQLIKSKKLNKCKGIIIGHLSGCELKNYNHSLTIEQVIEDRLKPLNIPIIKGLPFGHSYPNITIPIGCKARFDLKEMKLVLKQEILL